MFFRDYLFCFISIRDHYLYLCYLFSKILVFNEGLCFLRSFRLWRFLPRLSCCLFRKPLTSSPLELLRVSLSRKGFSPPVPSVCSARLAVFRCHCVGIDFLSSTSRFISPCHSAISSILPPHPPHLSTHLLCFATPPSTCQPPSSIHLLSSMSTPTSSDPPHHS